MFKVAIVGQPNVGKSSIFNRILRKRLSIVHSKAGITRDRIYAQAEWLTKKFDLIDTGGIEIKDIPFLSQIKYQVQIAINEAHLILFVLDGKIMKNHNDIYIAKMLHKSQKPVILVINKMDNNNLLINNYDFYSLGFSNVVNVSANHGIGMGELLDKIIFFHDKKEYVSDPAVIKFCLLGRPNVGKSTFVNAILSQERMVVSSIPGTTTDSVDSFFIRDNKIYQIIDTAGIKKKGKMYEKEEKYSYLRALSALSRTDIACLLLEANQEISEQDKNIAGLILKYNKACIIIVNKWDLIKKDTDTIKVFTRKIRQQLHFFHYAPIIFLSSVFKMCKVKLFTTIAKVFDNYSQSISDNLLNDILHKATLTHATSIFNNGKVQFYYIIQIKSKPPEFVAFVNNPKFIHFSYERFLKNQLRINLNLEGLPLKIIFKKKEFQDL